MFKILVVEDEINIRETLVDILEVEGYQVIVAGNGLIGSIKAIKERPDLIISDVNMPEMDGFEMLEALNGCMEEMIVPPFIFLTALVERSEIRKGMKLGADDYITKPFNNRELIDAVKAKINKRSQIKTNIKSKERFEISSELHDSIQQLLVASFMGFEAIKDNVALFEPRDQVVFKSALGLLSQANDDLRKFAHNVGQIDEIHDIGHEIRELIASLKGVSEIGVTSVFSIKKAIDSKIQTQLYRIIQESLNNILKHSKATTANIELTSNDTVSLKIKDNGIGFDTTKFSSGMGLMSLRKRAEEIGATIDFNSTIGVGTEVVINIVG